jgi:hypothetical protein
MLYPKPVMNLKRIFGAILTSLGIISLIYAAYDFISTGHKQWVTAIIIFIIGSIFFTSGINLIKGTKDEA